MSRVRNIAPGFFENEDLAEIGPLGQVLFAGLWCFADREGRLPDRPKRIKAWVFPYYDAEVDDLLDLLMSAGFIVRYSVAGAGYIQIVNFLKHQHPHPRETESTYPGVDEATPTAALPLYSGSTEQSQGALQATPRCVQGNALALSSPAGFRSDHDQALDQALDQAATPGREDAAGDDDDDNAELLAALRLLPKWPKERTDGSDLAKVRLWRKVYPDRLTLAEVCAMDSWFTQHRQRQASYQFVENWLRRPAREEESNHAAATRNGYGPRSTTAGARSEVRAAGDVAQTAGGSQPVAGWRDDSALVPTGPLPDMSRYGVGQPARTEPG